jgi:DNA-nicking Smr family endonuclease
MPRRRLHGETQKRRRKPQTRLLKRKDTVVRVRATHQPAAFERSSELEREDLAFLEAMRALEVQRNRWSGESHARRQAIETVQLLSDEGEQRLFEHAMTRLGVTPLGAEPPSPPHPPAHPGGPAPAGARAAAPSAEPSAGPSAGSSARPPGPAASGKEAAHVPPPVATRPAEPAGETFCESEDADPGLMERLLREGAFDPELKFAGSGGRPLRRNGSRGAAHRADPEEEPDGALDLHGKTQEEAIRMVQNFLLVGHRQRLRRLLIITGRGRNSGEGGPVLREAVNRWLERNGARYVREYRPAPGRLGGDGAIWVVLR